MKLLILGGTRFVGRHMTEAALEAGHEVTLFNRNRQGTDLGVGTLVETLVGDRLHDVSALTGRTWDAVIDVSAYTPAAARRSAEALRETAAHYTFISTISVYKSFAGLGPDEQAPVAVLSDEDAEAAALNEPVSAEAYGPLKARCEGVVRGIFPDGALVIRPGLIVGPYDYTDRFTYWVRRVGAGGTVLAPGAPEQRVQFIDAHDLARWTVQATGRGLTGTFNATGPDGALSMGTFLETCRQTLNPEAELTWVLNDFLLSHGLGAGDLMPWQPAEAMPGWDGFYAIDVGKAVGEGLSFRPLEETVRDTFAWDETRGGEPLKSGLTSERETALLDEWRMAKSAPSEPTR